MSSFIETYEVRMRNYWPVHEVHIWCVDDYFWEYEYWYIVLGSNNWKDHWIREKHFQSRYELFRDMWAWSWTEKDEEVEEYRCKWCEYTITEGDYCLDCADEIPDWPIERELNVCRDCPQTIIDWASYCNDCANDVKEPPEEFAVWKWEYDIFAKDDKHIDIDTWIQIGKKYKYFDYLISKI